MEIEKTQEKNETEIFFERMDEEGFLKGLMEEHRVNLRHVSRATGINYQHIYDSANKRMTKVMKSVFFMYFKYVIKVI